MHGAPLTFQRYLMVRGDGLIRGQRLDDESVHPIVVACHADTKSGM